MTLQAITINLVQERQRLANFFKKEKADGIKKAWYYYHHAVEEIMVLDNKDMYNDMVRIYTQQGFVHTKTMIADGKCGVKKANIHVFRNIDESKKYGFEPLTLAFDYIPADCEIVIVEICHTLPAQPQKKKKRK